MTTVLIVCAHGWLNKVSHSMSMSVFLVTCSGAIALITMVGMMRPGHPTGESFEFTMDTQPC